MNFLEKITDTLLSKNWVLTLISFVVSVVISIFIPIEFFEKLPFDSKVDVIVGFVSIAIAVFLILYLFVWTINKSFNKAQIEGEYQKIKSEEAEENIEQWRCFFDEISDEEYSILMYFVITENQRPYKEWGHKGHPYGNSSIFNYGVEDKLFYKTKSYEESPPYEVWFYKEKEPRTITSKGEATVYTLKEEFYQLLKSIIRLKGSLSHHSRKTYKLDFGNGSDLKEFQVSKYNNE